MHESKPDMPRALILLLAVLVPAAWGCDKAGEIRLVPVYPDDRPDLLAEMGVNSLEVRFLPRGEGNTNAEQWTTVERGERLSLRLAPGTWRASIRGVGDGGEVRGETAPFEVEAGTGGEIRFFLGEAGAFNLVRLEPQEIADMLTDLAGHTATTYLADDGGQRILVAGGRRGAVLSSDAFIIDPARFTIERVSSLGCARAGHTALVVDVDAGRRVVLAGGEGTCANELDVFHTASEFFERISVCGVADARPAVAEVERATGQLVQTGRVIAPGNPRCVVDVFTKEGGHDVPMMDTAPASPGYALANSQGQVLVVTPQRIFLDAAERGRSCVENDSWMKQATWLGIEERRDGSLVHLANDQFLFVGGRLPGGGDPDHNWTIVSLLRDCELSRVVEGVRADSVLPALGFVLIDKGSGSTLNMLVAGGIDASGEALDRVVLLVQPTQAAAPTIHDLSSPVRERLLRLARPRAWAATAGAPDGTAWIIGGGDQRPEILVGETGTTPTWGRFSRRKPTMRLAWIVDNGSEAPSGWFDSFLPALRTHVIKRLVNDLYVDLRTMVLVAANSDRGVDLGELGVGLGDLDNGASCGGNPTPIVVVATGDLEDVSLPGGIVEIPDEGQSGSPAGLMEEIDNVFLQLDKERSGCSWRQFFRRAFDGLSQTVVGDSGAIDLTTGITLVLFGARDDDCSQGVFGDEGSFTAVPPSAETLAAEHCTTVGEPAASQYDAYFGLPPGSASQEDMGRIIEQIAWDPSDAIFALFGACGGPMSADCSSFLFDELKAARRLQETVEWIGDSGSGAAALDLCGIEEAIDLEQLAAEVVSLVRGQLPLQVCVNLAVAGGKAVYDQVKGEFVPVPRDEPRAREVADKARASCRAMTMVQAGADARHVLAVPIDLEDCWAGTDSDRRGGCATDESGWLVRCDRLSTVLGTVTENAEFICLP